MPEVRCGRVAARHVRDDAAPTPLMEDVSIKPVTGKPFLFDVFLDIWMEGGILLQNLKS